MVLAAEVVELARGEFVNVEDGELAKLDRWFSETGREF
jgi:hypothetical protein